MICSSPYPFKLPKICGRRYLEKKCFKWPVVGLMNRLWGQNLPWHTCTLYSHSPAWIGLRHFHFGTDAGFGTSVPQDGIHRHSQPSASPPFSKRRTLPKTESDLAVWSQALAAASSPSPAQPIGEFSAKSHRWSQTDPQGTPDWHYANCWPWTTDLTLSKLSFLIHKMRLMKAPTLQGCCEDAMG